MKVSILLISFFSFFSSLSCITHKVYGLCEYCAYQTTALLVEIILLRMRTRLMMMRLTPSVCVEVMVCAWLLALLDWLQNCFIGRLKREAMRKFERKKEQNKAEHGESAIDGMHILVILLGSIDSMWYPVLPPDSKQCTGFFVLPFRSSQSWHMLHVIESHEPTPNDWRSSSIQIETTPRSGLTQTGSKSIW